MMRRMPHHRVSEAHEMALRKSEPWTCGGHNSRGITRSKGEKYEKKEEQVVGTFAQPRDGAGNDAGDKHEGEG